MKIMMLLISVMFVFSACKTSGNELQEEMPDDFAFSLKYGVTAANEINSYKDSFTKDLVMDGTETTALVLSEEELETFYHVFRESDVLNLPDEAGGQPCQSPYNHYELEMTADREEVDLTWDTECLTGKLSSWESTFHEVLIDLIHSREEYQNLPDAEGGYD